MVHFAEGGKEDSAAHHAERKKDDSISILDTLSCIDEGGIDEP